MNFAIPIYINRRGIWCIALAMGFITFINMGLALYWLNISCHNTSNSSMISSNRYAPLIFIGGFPRSGTTLMRSILDVHPDVRCGRETRIIPALLNNRNKLTRRLKSEIAPDVIDSAFRELFYEIISKHDYPATRLCNKDPFAMLHGQYIRKLFPNAKFLFIIRDARAVVHSVVTRGIKISEMILSDFNACFLTWNKYATIMDNQCKAIGTQNCLRVYYEQLVLQPKVWIEKITQFLNLTWNDNLLHHEQFINSTAGVSLSEFEKSTDQIVKPIYADALTSWFGFIPEHVLNNLAILAPLLANFGYDISNHRPDYSKMNVLK